MPHQITMPRHSRIAAPVEENLTPRARRASTSGNLSSRALAAHITRAASKQAYYTIRFLVDRDRTLDAYRAYAYFRWVDDWLDQRNDAPESDRVAFVERQQGLIERGYHGTQRGSMAGDVAPEERLLLDLTASDAAESSGLQSYIRNMMAVMRFDATRRGRLVSGQELDAYTRWLATAVTDALHHFIGHDHAPASELRYRPAMAAHITHMLRDTIEDNALGYFNTPGELLQAHGIGPREIESAPYRDWVRRRVELARAYFRDGARYLNQVASLRCRLAGYAYMARFAGILDAIERDGYVLRPDYPEFKRAGYGLRMSGSVCARALLRGKR